MPLIQYLKNWFIAARPKTLGASIAPVIIGSAMAYRTKNYSMFVTLATFSAAVLIQIATNYANDYFDFQKGVDRDNRIGPLRALQAGLVKPTSMKYAFIIIFFISFLIGLFLVWRAGLPIFILGVLSIAAGILYTSGPFPLGYHGLGDIFVLIFFGPVTVGGTYYIQTLDFNLVIFLAGLAPGLLATAILTVNNLRDVYGDKKSGKNTLVVRLGEKFARYEYLSCILLAASIPVIIHFIENHHPYILLSSTIIVIAFPMIRSVFINTIDKRLNKVLAQTSAILMLYSIIFALGWNIQK